MTKHTFTYEIHNKKGTFIHEYSPEVKDLENCILEIFCDYYDIETKIAKEIIDDYDLWFQLLEENELEIQNYFENEAILDFEEMTAEGIYVDD